MNDLPRDDDGDAISPEEERARHRVRLPGFVSEDDVGLGDMVKRATSAIGINHPCRGCERRARSLNRWMSFHR